jgi:hypothetical protein
MCTGSCAPDFRLGSFLIGNAAHAVSPIRWCWHIDSRRLLKLKRLGSSTTDNALPPQSTSVCPSCGNEGLGRFCRNCGEKRITEDDYSLRRYLKEIGSAITLLESKVLRSVWLVARRPGHLSSEYFRGRRVRYLKPLQLFVFLNVVYFVSLSLFTATTFTTPLGTQLHENNYYPAYASRRVDHKLLKKGLSYAALETKYNQRTGVLSKTLIFLLIPIFALLFFLLFFRKRKYFVEHLVVATHFWSFNLILLGVILPVITVLLIRVFKALNISAAYVTNDAIASSVLQICFGIYLFTMLRRAYGASRWYCGASATLMAWSFFHIVWLYRFLLFEVTLSAI